MWLFCRQRAWLSTCPLTTPWPNQSKIFFNTTDLMLWQAARKFKTKFMHQNLCIFTHFWHFRVPDLEKVCMERCENDLLECVIYCGNDSACISACMRLEQECEDSKSKFPSKWYAKIIIAFLGCPCGKLCPDGCTGCSNSVCQCEVNTLHFQK